uniref:Uncharacterized protein LOC114913178 n=1 Tax=Elaeis guineensis var. tenera TaxID=51953 RepID=A0A8N4ERK5_ELAGV|nr:uncharacterized protein LOC114913178 [Elaeis guineensis]
MAPVIWLSNRYKEMRLLKLPNPEGIPPWIWLLPASNIRRCVERFPMDSGRFPSNPFSDIYRYSRPLQLDKKARKSNRPPNPFASTLKNCRATKFPTVAGTVPVKGLWDRSTLTSLEALPIESGIAPVRRFAATCNIWSLESWPICLGIFPCRLFSTRSSVLSLVRLLRALGIVPVR